MSKRSDQVPKWAPAYPDLYNVYKDFLLSRQALNCRERTMTWYKETLLWILEWMVAAGVTRPEEIAAPQIRAYIAHMQDRKLSDYYIHNHARTIRTFTRFLYEEEYIRKLPKFQMPRIEERRLPFLTADQVEKVLKVCERKRDKALILTMVDTGARRAEVCRFNWEDVDIDSGLVQILEGKGGKTRSVVVGVATRRALLAYKRELNPEPHAPLFQTLDGRRFHYMGFRSLFDRLGKKAGVKITPHALRRSFAILSLKAGMNSLHLQALMGHTTLEMTRKYITMLEDDLIVAHREHGPIDTMLRRRK